MTLHVLLVEDTWLRKPACPAAAIWSRWSRRASLQSSAHQEDRAEEEADMVEKLPMFLLYRLNYFFFRHIWIRALYKDIPRRKSVIWHLVGLEEWSKLCIWLATRRKVIGHNRPAAQIASVGVFSQPVSYHSAIALGALRFLNIAQISATALLPDHAFRLVTVASYPLRDDPLVVSTIST